MTHAERCPVCNGSGKYVESTYFTITAPIEKTCHGCLGKGWVEVRDDYQYHWNTYPIYGKETTGTYTVQFSSQQDQRSPTEGSD